MNLVAKEYAVSQLEDDGVLVLSEMAGAAEELQEALLVNPFDVDAVAEALHRALSMPEDERRARMSALRDRVRRHDVHAWVNRFLEAAKVAVERALLERARAAPMAVCVLRFATVYGLSPRMRFDLTVNEFTMELLTKHKVTVYGEQFWRPYIHVRDVARAVALVLNSPVEQIAGQAFNVGDTSQNFQKGQLVALIQTEIGNHLAVARVPQIDDPRDYRVSFEKIQRVLGFRITYDVTAGIREVMQAITQGVITDCDHPKYRN